MAKADQKKATGLESDAWQRFEHAVDVVAKSPPQHRTSEKPKASPKKSGKPSKAVPK